VNTDQALAVSKLLWAADTDELAAAEERLKAKCRNERMSRTAVLIEWGDPRDWHGSALSPITPNKETGNADR
jgi:hypothetical protein